MRWLLRLVLVLVPSLHFTVDVLSQERLSSIRTDSNRLSALFSIAAGVQHGFIFAHSPAVENTKGANPTGIELIFSWQKNDPATWALCNCFPRNGLLMAYYDYDTEILGSSYSLAYFLEPVYKIGSRSFFSFRGVAGASYLTNPFDSVKNPTNRSYSTKISAYLLVGIGAWFPLSRQWWLNLSVNYQHESNGGLKQPNKGINWPTAGIQVSYQPVTRDYAGGVRTKENNWSSQPLRKDVSLFAMGKRALDEQGNSKRLPLIGIGFQIAKQVGRISNLTFGAEGYRDASLKAQLQRENVNASPFKAGLLAGHEFILGRFLFSQRLGIYIFDETPYYDLLFHRWGLQYRAWKHIAIGFNMQAHRQVADFVDLRVSFMM